MPEPHTLFTVVQPAASGRPAPSAAWRAGAWPWPAGSTQPMITSSTCSGLRPARSTAALIAIAAELGAGQAAKVALETAHGRAGGGNDDDGVGHGTVPSDQG
jgi:hypothetical protein